MMNKLRQNNGFTLMELMVTIGIFLLILSGITVTMISGEEAWTNTETQIQVYENIRMAMSRVYREVRQTGSDSSGAMQLTISDGTGVYGSDVFRFSMPVVCESGGNIVDSNGDVANWGAPLTWGCNDSSCMDADDRCATVDYKYVEYSIDAGNNLVRKVLDEGFVVLRSDIFAHNIANLQASLSADNNIVILSITVLKNTDRGRQIDSTVSTNIYLRNRG